MCGILGIINQSDCKLSDREVVDMRDTMTQRGPDDAGLLRFGNATLAHRRLSIRDAQHGRQPWVTQNQRFALIFNGEIYNDDEIRSRLRSSGVHTRTQCDTEVLAEAWAMWGESSIDLLRGMFAFGVVDRNTGAAWLVRDRCGVKPLFYAQVDNAFVFASSIAAIRRHPRFSSAPNFNAIRHYLQTLRLTIDRETMFQNLFSVRPGELIRIEGNRPHHRIWWTLPTKRDSTLSFEHAADEVERILDDAVAMRLKSDVPVGMMMSGGVDSNTLASVIKTHPTPGLVGVCGGGVDQPMDQSPSGAGGSDSGKAAPQTDFHFAKLCAAELNIPISEVQVNDCEYLETWQSLITQYETPVSTPTDVIIFHVSKLLKQSVGVAIGGEGADEAFCGYEVSHWSGNDFKRSQSLDRLLPAAADLARQSMRLQYGCDQFSCVADHYLKTNGLIPGHTQQLLIRPDYWPVGEATLTPQQYYCNLFNSQSGREISDQYSRVLFQANLESLLGRLDSATMAASLEARVPFTDHVLVEHAFSIPHHFNIDICKDEPMPWLSALELSQRKSLRSKRIVREIASRKMSPQLAQRPKQSFPTPLIKWMSESWRPWVQKTIRESKFAKEVFQPQALKEFSELRGPAAFWNWPLVNVILWGDACFD